MKKKKRYIKPITERLIVAPTSMMAASPPKLDQTGDNGYSDAGRKTNSSGKGMGLGTIGDTGYGDDEDAIAGAAKANPWGAWDEE